MAPLIAVAARRIVASTRQAACRRFQSAAPRKAAGGHEVHSHSNDPDAYIHAERMYDLPAMKNRKLKFGLAIGAVVGFGTAIPLVAVMHAQAKTSST